MYKSNQLWNIYFLRSQRISYRYRETPRCPSIYIIDFNRFLLLFLLTITKQKYFSSSPKLLFKYIVFEFTLLLVVQPRYYENYIVAISCTWEWASNFGAVVGGAAACSEAIFGSKAQSVEILLLVTSFNFFPPYFFFFLFLIYFIWLAFIVAWAFGLETIEAN